MDIELQYDAPQLVRGMIIAYKKDGKSDRTVEDLLKIDGYDYTH